MFFPKRNDFFSQKKFLTQTFIYMDGTSPGLHLHLSLSNLPKKRDQILNKSVEKMQGELELNLTSSPASLHKTSLPAANIADMTHT